MDTAAVLAVFCFLLVCGAAAGAIVGIIMGAMSLFRSR